MQDSADTFIYNNYDALCDALAFALDKDVENNFPNPQRPRNFWDNLLSKLHDIKDELNEVYD